MTATFLQSELSSLIQDSKKKFPDVRTAAERSLSDLKALSVTSETQLAGDLVRRPYFIDPFIFACSSRNVKLAGSGIVCLQRLTASRAVPRERLTDLIGALRDVAASSMDVQLKILQTLPSLLQLYEEDLKDSLLAATLEVCGALQSSKTAVISSTAAATFQQLTTTVFERVEDGSRHQKDTNDDQIFDAAADATRLFRDLCALANNEPPDFTQIKAISPPFLLEVIGSILTNHEAVFSSQTDMIEVCRTKLMPAVVSMLAAKINFPLAVRVLRLIYVLTSRHLDAMDDKCEEAISAMVRVLDPDQNPIWKRILCMEVFRAICQEAVLLPRMFELFDQNKTKSGVIVSLLAAFVRIASEDPSLIGLGRQSTVPSRSGASNNHEDIMLDTAGIGGSISSVVSADSTVTGISMEWSVARIPYMEQLDKSEPSDIPSTYIYSLVINCLVAIAEGLSKLVMPLSVPRKSQSQRLHESLEEDGSLDSSQQEILVEKTRPSTPGAHKYQRLLNPLNLKDHPRIGAVRVCANLIHACWPAFLATCSTFLNSALDSTFYHNLVRAFQKMTQVSGVLELSTPRDAFLTSLGKAATPINTYSLTNQQSREIGLSADDSTADEKAASHTPVSATPRQSVDINRPSLSIRNLLCLRALLNLGVALGPTLNSDSWFIVIETLLHVESLLTSVSKRAPSSGSQAATDVEVGETRTSLGAETIAVRNASKRMFESTRSYSDDAFSVVIRALFRLVGAPRTDDNITDPAAVTSPSPSGPGQRREDRTHQASRSMSGLWKTRQQQDHETSFVLTKLRDLGITNIHRFTSSPSAKVSWGLVVAYLQDTASCYRVTSKLRIQAASILNLIAAETISALSAEEADPSEATMLREKALITLLAQIRSLQRSNLSQRQDERSADDEIHADVLGTLESILGQNGESLGAGWRIVFDLIRSAFQETTAVTLAENHKSSSHSELQALSPEILQVAFRSLQLVVSDFLTLFNLQLLAELTDVMTLFGLQTKDLNISLTALNFSGSVASLLQEKISTIDISNNFQGPALTSIIEGQDEEKAAGVIWMLLITKLSPLCLDSRQDVRNSALRMVLRILEASGSKQTGAAWNFLIPNVFFRSLHGYHNMITSESQDAAKWQSTVSQLLYGMTEIVVQNIETIAKDPSFSRTSEQLFATIEQLLDQKSLSVWAVVFATTSKLLDTLRRIQVGSLSFSLSALRLFLAHHPADIFGNRNDGLKLPENLAEANQDSIVQHATVFAEIFLALKDCSGADSAMRSIDTARVMKSVRDSIFKCTHPPYTSDVKTLAPEQEKVVLILPMLRHLMQENGGDFTRFLLDFIQAALSRAGEDTLPAKANRGGKPAQTPTFVAFSSKCVDILDSMTSSFPDDENVFEVLAVPTSITTLAAIVNAKYSTIPQNSDSPLWQAASRTNTNIIATTIRHITSSPMSVSPTQLVAFFAAATTAARATLNTSGLDTLLTPPSRTKLIADETFDIANFQSLHASIIPTLGATAIPDSLRRTYILNLFNASLITEPWFFDLPGDLLNSPLHNLSTVRMGTVSEPVFLPRQCICYTALDALFALVSKHDFATGADEPSEIKHQRLTLATAAAPYMLLRVAHALKTFVADQPLRSLTPLPRPLRTELLMLLTKCVELRSENEAFAGLIQGESGIVAGTGGEGKAHLRILYPMVLRLQETWAWCPRLSGGGAWQEGTEGRGIEAKMREWGREISWGWDVIG